VSSIILVCCIIVLSNNIHLEDLQFSHLLITRGEYYRLLTGHLIHLNIKHFLLNAFALIGCAYLTKKTVNNIEWLFLFIISGLIISGCLFCFNPNIEHYIGLSGIVNAFVIITIFMSPHFYKSLRILLLSVLIIKISLELFDGSLFYTQQEGVAVGTIAHIYGIISGFICLFILKQRFFVTIQRNFKKSKKIEEKA
jgi:rhomboid family GlyGly-CTERM serine protease